MPDFTYRSAGVRKDVTPPLASDVPDMLAREAGLTRAEATGHLLSRITFGTRPRDRERVQRVGAAAFLEDQLHPERIDDSVLEERLARFEVLRQDSGALVQKLVAQRKEGKREAMLKDAPPPPEGERVEQPMRPNAAKRDFTGRSSRASRCILRSKRSCRSGAIGRWRWCTRWVRPIPRARTATRRTSSSWARRV